MGRTGKIWFSLFLSVLCGCRAVPTGVIDGEERVHTGYVGSVEPAYILLSFLQYLPAGYCLCFAYRRSGTIISPILMHMIVNAVAVYSMR